MFANVLAAALRNLSRNRLYAAVGIGALAIGMAAALLTALFVRDELSFDQAIPGHERVYVVVTRQTAPGRGQVVLSLTPAPLAAWLRQDVREVAEVTRYAPGSLGVRHGLIEANEALAWVDPNFFSIMPMKALAGDLATALQRPDAVVLTRAMARKYFGRDAPLGEILEFQRRNPMRVAAVIEDRPANSNIQAGILVSGLAPASDIAVADRRPYRMGEYLAEVRTFVKLRDSRYAPAVDAAMPGLISRRMAPPEIAAANPSFKDMALTLTPITAMHMLPDPSAEGQAGSMAAVYALSLIAGLILLAAGANFVNLQTARGARRALEVGVRKAAGGGRGQLMIQFLAESVTYAVIAAVCALALAELALPALSALAGRRIPFAYWREPLLLAAVAGLTLLVGLCAGLYPALVLSAFRPAAVLNGGPIQGSGSAWVRRALVVLQFAVLIVLLLAVPTIYAQTRFSMTRALGLDIDQMIWIRAPSCHGPFEDTVHALPGVAASACSSPEATGLGDMSRPARKPDGQIFSLNYAAIGYGFFEAYGVRPLAGRLPSRSHGGDGVALRTPADIQLPASVVVNAAAVRALGFPEPDNAIGKALWVQSNMTQTEASIGFQPVIVIGVVPDITYDTTKGAAKPTFYYVNENELGILSVKLKGERIPQTLAAIDGAWARAKVFRPIRRAFVNVALDRIYAGVIVEGWLVAALAGIAAFIAGLGLFALAAFTAQQRIKEIGVRKAMGASTADILALLLWSFTRPVLLANLIAWPLGGWALDHWLHGFSARISLSPWLFLAAGGAALAIAAATVSAQALGVARARPVGALRHE